MGQALCRDVTTRDGNPFPQRLSIAFIVIYRLSETLLYEFRMEFYIKLFHMMLLCVLHAGNILFIENNHTKPALVR